jgi:hypothetical protein
MPGGNGTGPLGRGPLTGRGLGPCGRGYGRGLGYYDYYEPYPVDENTDRSFLENEKAMLEARLKDINEALDEDK